jgi:hypothetical protein
VLEPGYPESVLAALLALPANQRPQLSPGEIETYARLSEQEIANSVELESAVLKHGQNNNL